MSNFFNSTERSSSLSTRGCWFYNLGAEPSFVVFFIKSHQPFEEAAGWTSTSQSCFLSSNLFIELGHLFSHTWACYIKCMLDSCSPFLNMPKSGKWEKGFAVRVLILVPTCVFLGDLADAIRSHTNITFGLYHSLFEWFNPLYLKDSAKNFSTQDYVKVHAVIEYR